MLIVSGCHEVLGRVCHPQKTVVVVIVTGCGDNAIRLFQASAMQNSFQSSAEHNDQSRAFQLAVTKHAAHDADVNCVRWSPSEPSLLASAGDDNTIRLWRYTPDPDHIAT